MIQNYESARKPTNSAFIKKEGSFKEDFNSLRRGWVNMNHFSGSWLGSGGCEL